MQGDKVSVIVPCYNQEAYIAEALDSVLEQTYENWECIVVDDGSTDGSRNIVLEYSKKNPKIVLLEQENSGVCIARNAAVLRSTGKFVLPLDADDLIAPSYIEKAMSAFAETPDAKLVYCRAERFGLQSGLWRLPEYSFERLLWGNMIFCTALFRKSDFEKCGGYNPNMKFGFEDWDFWLSFLSPKDKVIRLDEVLFFYRIKSVSRTTVAIENNALLKRQIYRNHRELYEPFAENIIDAHNELLRLQNDSWKNSYSFRVGYALLTPMRLLKKIVKKLRAPSVEEYGIAEPPALNMNYGGGV